MNKVYCIFSQYSLNDFEAEPELIEICDDMNTAIQHAIQLFQESISSNESIDIDYIVKEWSINSKENWIIWDSSQGGAV